MAVYQHTYHRYAGQLTPLWSRFLIIPRYAFRTVFQSRIFTGLFVVCFAPLLVMAILIYFRHNTTALGALNLSLADVSIRISPFFFRVFTNIQVSLGFILTVIVGPSLISRDLSNNALPLYLCRPLTRTEYVLGKASVIVFLLSAITWVPLLILFFFESYLEGGNWLWENLFVSGAILMTSWLWIVVLSLLATALSALVKWRLAASALLFAIFVVPTPVTAIINELFHTWVGIMIHPGLVLSMIMDNFFRLNGPEQLIQTPWQNAPVWSLWASIVTLVLICLGVLAMKVRAYEVIK